MKFGTIILLVLCAVVTLSFSFASINKRSNNQVESQQVIQKDHEVTIGLVSEDKM